MLEINLKTTLSAYQKRVESQLSEFFERNHAWDKRTPPRLAEAIRYASLTPGKRLRPALVYATGEALEIPADRLDSMACALELIHAYSLVHDDLPAMDDDDLRRGRPTCHIQYDEATAILVGDALQSLAYEVILKDSKMSPQLKTEALTQLVEASGPKGMIGGQMHDIEATNTAISLEQLQQLHEMKTAALIQTALLLGALPSARYTEIQPGLAKLGQMIGLAFQVHDDIIDIESATEKLGKRQGRDNTLVKSTYPKLMGLESAKKFRDRLIQNAQQQLTQLKLRSPFLKELIQYIAQRDH